MVVRLADTLNVPLRHRNLLLLAAGFAPMWRESDLTAPEMAPVARAISFILAQQEPFPAVAVDRTWNLMQANRGAVRLVEYLVGPLTPGTPINLADALVAPNMLKPFLVNWAEVVSHFIRSVETDAALDGSADATSLLSRPLEYEGVRSALDNAPPVESPGPVLPMHFRKGDVSLRLFTTIATLGTPLDITLQELRIESFFPLDDATASFMHGWAAKG
jgi:hypothetical protein